MVSISGLMYAGQHHLGESYRHRRHLLQHFMQGTTATENSTRKGRCIPYRKGTSQTCVKVDKHEDSAYIAQTVYKHYL